MRSLLAAFALLFSLGVTASSAARSASPAPESFTRAHRMVTTTNARAQEAFDDGLTLLYAYNPAQARRSFERALALDPTLAIAWWGVALSYGPNINTGYDADEAKRGRAAVARASAAMKDAAPVERALIAAVSKRFAFTGPQDGDRSARAYHDAMVGVATHFADDDDVQALTAEAGMDERPWAFYKADGTPEAGTRDIVERLQLVLARTPAHIGAEHFLIHAVEASKQPGVALEAARGLAGATFEPGAEHLTHMPAHTFERVGEYHEAGVANARAIDAFTTYLSNGPESGHAGYLGHDCLFGVDAFMMAGEYARASQLAQTCGTHDGGESLLSIVQERFHRYGALAASGPSDFVTGMLALHDRDVARARQKAADLALQKDSETAQVAADILRAAVDRAKGNEPAEVAALSNAVSLQDAEGYQEPPAFWYPAREALGAAQLRDENARAAAATFRADLERNPNNPRSLFGLSVALQRAGDATGASDARARFEAAWAHADVALTIDDL